MWPHLLSRCSYERGAHHRVRQLRVQQIDRDAAEDELEDRHVRVRHRLQLRHVLAQRLAQACVPSGWLRGFTLQLHPALACRDSRSWAVDMLQRASQCCDSCGCMALYVRHHWPRSLCPALLLLDITRTKGDARGRPLVWPDLEHGLEAVRLGAEEVDFANGVPRAHQQRVDVSTCRLAFICCVHGLSWLYLALDPACKVGVHGMQMYKRSM